jgi:hypothetical protein
MIKSKIFPMLLGASLAFSGAFAHSQDLNEADVLENTSNQVTAEFSENIKKLKNDLGDGFFTNQILSDEDMETQDFIIYALDKVYFSKKTLTKEEKFELYSEFVRNIIRGYNDAAETIWEYSLNNNDFNIDLSYYSKSNITPLMGAAISTLEGGNVEYAIKLIERGANPSQTTLKNNINTVSLAATKDSHKVLTTLIISGANPMIKDDMGLTAYDYAKKHESNKSLLILLNLFINATE